MTTHQERTEMGLRTFPPGNLFDHLPSINIDEIVHNIGYLDKLFINNKNFLIANHA